jgi:membrane-associated phospholipid phosphatase
MKKLWNQSWFTIPVLLFFIGGLWVVFSVPYGGEIILLNAWRQEPLNSFFRFFTKMGEEQIYYVGVVLALFFRFRWALLLAILGLFVMPIAYTFKDKIGTERPMTYFASEDLINDVVVVPDIKLNSGRTSFPSGHTMSAFAFYGFIALLLRRKQQWLGVILAYTAILVGISRIFLVQHFMMDVLGGATIGLGIACFIYYLEKTKWLQNIAFLNKGILNEQQIAQLMGKKQKRNFTNEGKIP